MSHIDNLSEEYHYGRWVIRVITTVLVVLAIVVAESLLAFDYFFNEKQVTLSQYISTSFLTLIFIMIVAPMLYGALYLAWTIAVDPDW